MSRLIAALNCGIYHKNVSSLENGFKTPQVIEWFFQKQAEFREYESNLKIKHKFMLKEGPAHFEASLPLVVYLSVSVFMTISLFFHSFHCLALFADQLHPHRSLC
jgi:hypothetical protein